jgi:hypothetical protein
MVKRTTCPFSQTPLRVAAEGPRSLTAMDILSRLSYIGVFAVWVLPALAVLCLRKTKLSVLIGGLIFWGWAVLLFVLLQELSPSAPHMAPIGMLLFGLPFGLTYCAMVARTRGTEIHVGDKRSGYIISLIVWSAMIMFCVFVPFIIASVNRRGLSFNIPYLLMGVGPIL